MESSKQNRSARVLQPPPAFLGGQRSFHAYANQANTPCVIRWTTRNGRAYDLAALKSPARMPSALTMPQGDGHFSCMSAG